MGGSSKWLCLVRILVLRFVIPEHARIVSRYAMMLEDDLLLTSKHARALQWEKKNIILHGPIE